ncbi:hypothetical protein D3C81_2022350 [compost metagenome]
MKTGFGKVCDTAPDLLQQQEGAQASFCHFAVNANSILLHPVQAVWTSPKDVQAPPGSAEYP